MSIGTYRYCEGYRAKVYLSSGKKRLVVTSEIVKTPLDAKMLADKIIRRYINKYVIVNVEIERVVRDYTGQIHVIDKEVI